MNQLREKVLTLVKRSQNVKFSGKRITGSFTFEKQEDITLIQQFEAGNFVSIAKFTTNDDCYEVEPPRYCRRLNNLREYDNENTKLHP